jgi:hypothetical protein
MLSATKTLSLGRLQSWSFRPSGIFLQAALLSLQSGVAKEEAVLVVPEGGGGGQADDWRTKETKNRQRARRFLF